MKIVSEVTLLQSSLPTTSFRALLAELERRQLNWYGCSDLYKVRHPIKGASFRYDIHLRDIPNTYEFVREHARLGIPGTFFLQLGYSSNEHNRLQDYVDLARFIEAEGLEIGLHASPADSYFIWQHHGGSAREYAAWLREHGQQYLSELVTMPEKLAELHSKIEQYFLKFSEQARSILGPFTLVAAHGGEIGQIMRPLLATMKPAECEIFHGLTANRWMTLERLKAAGAVGDVQQFLSATLRQATDGGGGYARTLEILKRIPEEVSVQMLIHPYGWGNSKVSISQISTDELKPQSLGLKLEPLTNSNSVAGQSETGARLNSAKNQAEVAVATTSELAQREKDIEMPTFTVLNLAAPDQSCKSACARTHEKWITWFARTFKNTEQNVGGLRYSVPRIPLAIIETAQSEAEYLKLIGDKSRNMLRKAAKNGYTASVFNSADYLDDIHSIRTSKEIRSGKPVPEIFRQRPLPFDSANNRLCDHHQVTGVGIFNNQNTLVAYAAIHNCGDLAIINTILGHGDHLKFGIMNLLVFGAYREIKARFPNVKYINYLTLRSSTPQLDTFKKSVGFVPREFGLPLPASPEVEVSQEPASRVMSEPAQLRVLTNSMAIQAQTGLHNPIAELIEHRGFRKILIRGDCCSIRTVARNPQLFGTPQIVHNEKCTTQVYLDHLQDISYAEDDLRSISNLDAMAPSLRRYYINQNKADFLWETGADLLVIDSYADSFFQLWENKKSKAKLWINAKYLHDRALFEREHVKLPRKTFHEVLVDTQKIIEHVRRNNPDIPVLYLTHPIHYYRYLNSRREFCYIGQELERFMPNVYWGTHLPKEECEPIDMNSCGPGETHHYTPETYAKMVLAAASRNPVRTEAQTVW